MNTFASLFRGFYVLGTLVVALGTSACSSSSNSTDAPPNAVPVIDSVEVPGEVTAQNGTYTVVAKIMFHDADKDAITKIRYKIPAANIDKTGDLADASSAAVGAQLGLILPGNAPKETFDLTLSVIDGRGAESVAVTKQVTLK